MRRVSVRRLIQGTHKQNTESPSSPQERCSSVREEVRGLLTRAGVGSMRIVPVRRSYAFENKDVPHGEQWVLKVRAWGENSDSGLKRKRFEE